MARRSDIVEKIEKGQAGSKWASRAGPILPGMAGGGLGQLGLSLDATGNWSTFKQDNNGHGTWELNQNRISNVVNEITGITQTPAPPPPWWSVPAYNAAGNMTSVPRPADPTQTFVATYDAWNRLVKLAQGTQTLAEYVYDGVNRRAVKRTFTAGTLSEIRHFYYSEGWQILEERVGSGVPQSLNADRQFLWGLQYIDQLICRWRRLTGSINDEVLYAVQDANWNVVGIWGQVGGVWGVQQRQSYDPYGQVTYLNASTFATTTDAYDWETLYAGYRFDKESRMYQVRNRYYNPALGTWVSRDQIEVSDHHLYLYVFSSPLGSTDPSGTRTYQEPPWLITTLPRVYKGEVAYNCGCSAVQCQVNNKCPDGDPVDNDFLAVRMVEACGMADVIKSVLENKWNAVLRLYPNPTTPAIKVLLANRQFYINRLGRIIAGCNKRTYFKADTTWDMNLNSSAPCREGGANLYVDFTFYPDSIYICCHAWSLGERPSREEFLHELARLYGGINGNFYTSQSGDKYDIELFDEWAFKIFRDANRIN